MHKRVSQQHPQIKKKNGYIHRLTTHSTGWPSDWLLVLPDRVAEALQAASSCGGSGGVLDSKST
jgi:hypothetical protein